MAQVYEAAGQRSDEEDYLTRASEAFARVTEIIPSDKKTVDDVASAINGLGNVYYGRGDNVKAIENYRVATTLVPRYAYAWHDMFAAYVALAQAGKVDLAAMCEALQKTKEYGAGIPGLDAGYIAQLEGMLAAWDVPPAAAGAAAAQSGEPGSQ
jgi:tetratricopeptide (TPR) repeat protein